MPARAPAKPPRPRYRAAVESKDLIGNAGTATKAPERLGPLGIHAHRVENA